MAFIPTTTFLPATSRAPSATPLLAPPRRAVARQRRTFVRQLIMADAEAAAAEADTVQSRDAMEFFRHREGKWCSWRVTHHLAFRRSESGESAIEMKCLEADDERIVSLCRDWDIDPSTAQGGCHVTWCATLAWDQEGDNHEGETVFALVPDDDDIRCGKILRDRGYAEIVPIAGTYHMDEDDALNLETPYEGGAVIEKFSFDGPNVVNRLSTVKRFGGYSTATFATEQRMGTDIVAELPEGEDDIVELFREFSLFGRPTVPSDASTAGNSNEAAQTTYRRSARFATVNSKNRPSANSAFGSGFSSGPAASDVAATSRSATVTEATAEMAEQELPPGVTPEIMRAAEKAGVNLLKIPPSMRDDFVASFNADAAPGSK